jgi:hypothetical protein
MVLIERNYETNTEPHEAFPVQPEQVPRHETAALAGQKEMTYERTPSRKQ